MLGLFRQKKDPPVVGDIAYFGLAEWWLYEFTDEERDLIRRTYTPMGMPDYQIDRGRVTASSQSAADFASGVAAWFNKENTRHIGYKFIRKADEYGEADLSPMSLHFAMQARCQFFYRWRDHDPGALEEAIKACERGISISDQAAAAFARQWGRVDVGHYCFRQLAIIEEKRGDLDRAISLCHLAMADGWQGDWEKRISRLERKRAKVE